jgi:hypothetical protein
VALALQLFLAENAVAAVERADILVLVALAGRQT